MEAICRLRMGGDTVAQFANKQILKLALEPPADGGDGHFTSDGVKVLRSRQVLAKDPRMQVRHV